jgi:Ca-activated chloride channel family protein
MLTEDISPNRLESAKRAISKLIDNLSGDRTGIVVFAGKAYVQLPLTNDYAAAKMFLSTINPNLVPSQGTAIAHAISLASGSFKDEKHSRAIIIITDGEDHEGNAIEEATKAVENGIRVFTIGIGSPEGSPIPDFNSNGQKVGFKKDQDGKTVVSSLNETILQQIASSGNGVYVRSANTQASLKKVVEEIDSMEKQEYDTRIFSDYEDRFYYFLWPALGLLLIELFIAARKSKWVRRLKLFENRKSNA